MTLDLTQLHDEVIEQWDKEGTDYLDSNEIYHGKFEHTIKPEYQDILNNPKSCIEELGFDTFADYMASKNEETV